MKQIVFFSKKTSYVFLVGLCIFFVMIIGIVNNEHWNSVSVLISYGGVSKYISNLLVIIMFSMIVIYVIKLLEKNKQQQIYFWVLPVAMIITKLLMVFGFGIKADGKEWWISFFGYGNVSYVIIMVFLAVAFSGRWINHLIEMKMKKEVLIVALYATSILILSVMLFRGLSGGLIVGLYIIIYYICCSKKKNKYAVFGLFSVALIYAIVYGVEKKASFTYAIKILRQVFEQNPDVIKQRELFVAGNYEELSVWYAYYNPFTSIKEYMSNIGVLFVIIAYILILVLLYLYAKKFIVSKEDERYAISLVIAMAIGTMISVLKHLGVTGIDVGVDLPFLIQNGFIWIEVVLIVFLIPSKDIV